MDNCILLILSHHKVKSLLLDLRASFARPIVTIILWDRIHDNLDISQEEYESIGPVYSLPKHYRRISQQLKNMTMHELDELQASLEKSLNVRNNGLVVSSDRNFRNISDYRTARELQICNMSLVKLVFEEHSFINVMAGREDYLRNLACDYALSIGVPAHEFVHTRHCGMRMVALDCDGHYVGFQQAFDTLCAGGEQSYDAHLLASADAQYEYFLSKPIMPRFAVDGARSFVRSLASVFTTGVKSVVENARMYRRNLYDRISGELTSPWRVLSKWPAKAVRMLALDHTTLVYSEPTAGEKYLYVPMHMSPECVDMYYGRDYSLHESFIAELARRVPSQYCLYVKENSAMVGQRPLSFYNRLNSLYNVKMIHHNVDTFDLINDCAAVISVTGTAGWEAYLMNKPVVVLGNVFYDSLPGVLRASIYDHGFSTNVSCYIDTFVPDMEERRQAMRACFICSTELGVEVGMGDMENESKCSSHYAKILVGLAEQARALAPPKVDATWPKT